MNKNPSANHDSRKKPPHGGCGTLTYARWKSMMARCYNKNATNYQYYGAKGIAVCAKWHSFSVFRSEMGECPDKSMTLDRVDSKKNYEPGNCRWVTQADQNRNRSYCVHITFNGDTKIVEDWAKLLNISANTLRQRLYLGWSVEKALTTPIKKRSKK